MAALTLVAVSVIEPLAYVCVYVCVSCQRVCVSLLSAPFRTQPRLCPTRASDFHLDGTAAVLSLLTTLQNKLQGVNHRFHLMSFSDVKYKSQIWMRDD